MHLFHQNNTGGFLPLPLENRKCNISHLPIVSRGFLVAFGNWKEKHIQSIGNKKCERCWCEIDILYGFILYFFALTQFDKIRLKLWLRNPEQHLINNKFQFVNKLKDSH
jgi:hypothetical protein